MTSDVASLPRWWVVGFSGHRTLARPADTAKLLSRALDSLAGRNPWLAGISSVAAGADTLFCEEMLHRGYPLSVVLPFPAARFQQDFAGDRVGWARVEAVIAKAGAVEVVHAESAATVSAAAIPGPGSVAPSPAADDDTAAYMEAGVRTIDQADLLVAVWDEQLGKGFGGTADAVQYARGLGLPVVIVNPISGHITEVGFDGLRIPDGQPARPQTAIADPKALVERYFEAVDAQAEQSAPLVRQLVRVCVWLHLVAASIAAAVTVFPTPHGAVVAAALIDVGVLAIALTLLAVRGTRYRPWLRLRSEAEVCRSFLATWDIRRLVPARYHPTSTLPGLSALYATLRLLGQMDRSPAVSLAEARQAYEDTRVSAQIRYFEQKLGEAHVQEVRRRGLTKLCTTGALVASLLLAAAAFTGTVPERAARWLEFVAIVLPLLATACGVLLITDDSSRRTVRYAEMARTLRVLLPRLHASRTWESLARVSASIESELLQEVIEWRAFARHTEHVH
jgi:hypothetical protein